MNVTWSPYYPGGWHNEEEPNLTTPAVAEALNGYDAYNTQVAAAINTGLVQYSAAVPDGITDNSAYFNTLPLNGSPTQYFKPNSIVLCKSPIILQRRTNYLGAGLEGGAFGGATILFDNTTIMPGGNSCTVTANGTTWVFSNFGGTNAPHGLTAGNTFGTYRFATTGFNSGDIVSSSPIPFAFLITAATTTTFTIANTTIPAGSDTGYVGVHLVRFGVPGGNVTPSSLLSQLMIDANDIPGSSGLYTNDAQEMCGVDGVNIVNYRWRGMMVDGTGTTSFKPSKFPLNWTLRHLRTVSSDILTAVEQANVLGYDEWGGNVSNGRFFGLTCANGNSILSTKQVRFNKCNGVRTQIHVEDATDGILIGDLWGNTALEINSFTGTSTITTALRLKNNTAHPNTQISVGNGYSDGSTNVFVDEQNSYTPSPNFIGRYVTDANGSKAFNSLDPAKVVQVQASTTTLTNTSTETTLWTGATIPAGALAVGQVYRVRFSGTFDNIATSGAINMFVSANGTHIQGSNQMAASQTSLATNVPFVAQYDITITATGSGGSVRCHGFRSQFTAAGAGSTQAMSAATPDVSVNLSAGLTPTVSFTTVTANTGNTVRLDSLVLTQLA